MRILDYLNKRVTAPQTSALPLISSVVLLPPNADSETLQNIEAVGGANSVISLPCSTSEILSTILHVLYRRRLVETTFRDLKEINQTERYPYLSIFAQNSNQLDSKDGDNDDNLVSTDEGADENKETSSQGLFAIPNDMSYIVVKNNDDWSHCSSMLPRALKKMRHKERQKHPVSERKGLTTLTERLHLEAVERDKTDNAILKKLTSSAAVSAQRTKSQLCGNEQTVAYALSVLSCDSQDAELDLDSVPSSPSVSGSSSSDESDTLNRKKNTG